MNWRSSGGRWRSPAPDSPLDPDAQLIANAACSSASMNMVDGNVWFMCFRDSNLFSQGSGYEFILDSNLTHPALNEADLRQIILHGATGEADCGTRRVFYGQGFPEGC